MAKTVLRFDAMRTSVLAVGVALLSACGSHASSSAVPAANTGGGNTTLSAVVPAGASVSSASGTRKAQYVTSQTNGIIVYAWAGTQPSSPSPIAQANWSSGSALCTASNGGRSCSITFNAPVSTSNTTIVVDVYDQAPTGCASNGYCSGGVASGSHLISVGESSSQTISANGANQVTVQTYGVLASIQIAVSGGAATATGLDADGMAIGSQCVDGSTPLAVTPISAIALTASGFSFSGSPSFSSSSCSLTGLSAGSNSGFITASATSSRGTLSGVSGYDVVSGGSGSSGPVAVQTVTSAGGTIGFTPSNSASNSSSNFGGGSFSFGVSPGSVSGSATLTIAEVAPTTLSAFIPASNMRSAQYSSGGTSNPNVVLYGFALAVGGGTLTSSLQLGGTLQVTNGTLADALGSSGTLYVASIPAGSSSCTSSCVDAGSVTYVFYATNATTSDPTGSCANAGIATNCLVLGTFTPASGGIMSSGVYMLYIPAAVVVTGSNCNSNGGNTCTTPTLTSSGNASLTVQQPGPGATTFTVSSDTCSGVLSSYSATVSANPGTLNLTLPAGPLNGSCQLTVTSSAGGAPATVNVSVSIAPPTPTVTLKFGTPTGSNYKSFPWASGPYLVLGSTASVPVTITGTASSVTLTVSAVTPSGHATIPSSTFSLSPTSPATVTSLPATVTLSYNGSGKYKASATMPSLGAEATIAVSAPGSPVISLDPTSSLGNVFLTGGTFTVEATCLTSTDDNANENSALDLAEDATPGCP